MNKLLTIAIPTFNRKDYLEIALKSIYCQIDERVEILVSDNCSEDGTQELIANKYAQIKYYRNERNIGMGNFKRCYDRAEGDFILLLGDDDLVVEGMLKRILEFLEINRDVKLVFLNHTFFRGEFDGNTENSFAPNENGNFVTTDKERFISIAQHQLTFISCMILSRKAYQSIENVEQYTKNWFLQTCVAFEVTKAVDSELGVISDVCIAQNTLDSNGELNMKTFVDVFIKTESAVFTDIGVKCGYPKNKMTKIYSDFACSNIPYYILACKARNAEWKKTFWDEGFPVLKNYPKAWVISILTALIPAWFAKIAYNLRHYVKRK